MTQDTGAGSGYGTPSSPSYGSTEGVSGAPTTPITTPASTSGATTSYDTTSSYGDSSTSSYGTSTSSYGDTSTKDVAKDQAAAVAGTAKDQATAVAGTAKEQAKEVASEAKTQARDLLHQSRSQVRDQARQGQRRAADGLTSISDELRQMADTGQSGMASDVARQVADKMHDVALWLQKREPGDLIDEARNWARRNPGTFLIGAALAGLAAGRLTRGIVDDRRDDSGGGTIGSGTAYGSGYDSGYDTRYRTSSDPGYGTTGLGAASPAPMAAPSGTMPGTTPDYSTSTGGTGYDPAYTGAATGDPASDLGRGMTSPGMGAAGTSPVYEPGTTPYDDDRGYGTGGGTTGRTTS